MGPEGRLAWRRFAGRLPCTPLLGDGVSQSMGPDANRQRDCTKPLRGFVSSRLSSIAEPERLVSCGGDVSVLASFRRAGRATTGAMLQACLTEKEDHQIRQCRNSGSSPEVRVAAGHVIQGHSRRGVVILTISRINMGMAGRHHAPKPQTYCSWRRPARPRGPSSEAWAWAGLDVRGTEAISMSTSKNGRTALGRPGTGSIRFVGLLLAGVWHRLCGDLPPPPQALSRLAESPP
ncbi:hypothetical protein B0T18DRAFT_201550 [Schizothecium vesticola]|uniref:Uncharacterized protein n=1 Tax=Schizothecium vesticola TaxID=314040 RepID=A0AA40BTF0_9PEZI|nr:hypothetical protein B0T18DRAFT_201550 [Schizothecium vesticola]